MSAPRGRDAHGRAMMAESKMKPKVNQMMKPKAESKMKPKANQMMEPKAESEMKPKAESDDEAKGGIRL